MPTHEPRPREDLDVVAALTEATRTGSRDVGAALDTLVRVARDSTPGIDEAGISVVQRDGRIETRAATDDWVARLDQTQYELGEGPCLRAIDDDPVVWLEHAEQDTRWPRFVAVAVQAGLRAQLGLRVMADEGTLGALNLYSTSADTLTDEALQMGELFAVHAAAVLGHRRQVEDLTESLETRRVIGIALGLVMTEQGVDEDAAFASLVQLSARAELPIREAAELLLERHRGRLRPRRR